MGHSQSLSIALDQINLHVSDRDTSASQSTIVPEKSEKQGVR